MTEIDKKNLKKLYLLYIWNYLYSLGGFLSSFTQSHILGLETFIGRMLHIVGALGPAIASGFYLKSNNIKFKHFVFNKRKNSSYLFHYSFVSNFDTIFCIFLRIKWSINLSDAIYSLYN